MNKIARLGVIAAMTWAAGRIVKRLGSSSASFPEIDTPDDDLFGDADTLAQQIQILEEGGSFDEARRLREAAGDLFSAAVRGEK